mgnify:CR=1 FL=1
MANFITGGRDMFNAAMFGVAHQDTAQFFESRRNTFSETLMPIARQFHSEMNQLYRGYDESTAMRLAKAAVRKVQGIFRPSGIAVCNEIGHFQQANPDMQRWIMAEPAMRKLYHAQQCHGYDGTYVDLDPGTKPGWTHYDYRQATNSIFVPDSTDNYSATTWHEELLPGDRDLTMEEKVTIQESWGHLSHFLRRKLEDPTDPLNGHL